MPEEPGLADLGLAATSSMMTAPRSMRAQPWRSKPGFQFGHRAQGLHPRDVDVWLFAKNQRSQEVAANAKNPAILLSIGPMGDPKLSEITVAEHRVGVSLVDRQACCSHFDKPCFQSLSRLQDDLYRWAHSAAVCQNRTVTVRRTGQVVPGVKLQFVQEAAHRPMKHAAKLQVGVCDDPKHRVMHELA